MKASIVVITKNQKHFLQKSFPVLLSQDLNGKYEIIVVDSGSTDGAVEYIKSLPVKLVHIPPESFNYARAFNKGAKHAKGKFLVRLSGDVIPIGTRWLFEMIKPFSDSKVGGTYGVYTITNKKGYGYPGFWPARRFPKKLTRYSITPSPFDFLFRKRAEKVFNFAGGCCTIRREIWEKRPFNEKLLAAEDAEYAWFLHLSGYDIACNPKAKVIHEHKIESKTTSLYQMLYAIRWGSIFWWEIARQWIKYYFGSKSKAIELMQ